MKRMHSTDIMHFIRQFATLLSAGVPAVRSCEIIESSQQHRGLSSLLHQLKRDMLAGNSLYAGFARHQDQFNPLVCQLIRVGEETGKLDDSLQRIALYLEKKYALKQQIQRALFYPTLTAMIAFIITLGMLLFVIPRFAELFQASSIILPWWTRVIFAISFFLRHQALTVFLFLTISISLSLYFLPEINVSATCKNILLRLPIMNKLQHQITLTRLTRNLAITFSAGLSLPDAIQLCMTGPPSLKKQLLHLQTSILGGLPLHQAMQHCSSFPRYMIQMIHVGEESGKLDTMLHHLADKMESDLQHRINQLSQLLEPLIMVTLGVVIGGLVIGMYLPIFKLGSAL